MAEVTPQTTTEWITLGKRKRYLRESGVKYEYVAQDKAYKSTDPEEEVRAAFYVELVERYKYPPDHIDLEVEVPRREPKDRADIVVFHTAARMRPYCVVECKPDGISEAAIEQALKQAWGNANNLGAEIAMLVAGNVRVVFDPKRFDPADREAATLADLPVRYGRVPTYRYWKSAPPKPDLQVVTEDELTAKFQQCHDILWEGGKRNPAEAFDEMSKLMFCKLQDERVGTGRGERYAFQCGTNETVSEVVDRVNEIYADASQTAPQVFRTPIKADPALVYRVVEVLQGISLNETDLDAKGRAFEKFQGVVFRGEMGQYFTNRHLVEFMVDMLEPTRHDMIIDPACGSGGFLLWALDRVRKSEEARLGKSNAHLAWREWALRCLHGIEINEQISRIAMMGMIIHEDGHTNIKCADALATFEDLNSLEDQILIKPGTYTLLMTNPPFGAKVTRVRKGEAHPYLDTYELGGKVRRRDSQKTEILFLERCWQLLEPGGRIGIVIPDNILSNRTLAYVRAFMTERFWIQAIVSTPYEAFKSSGANVKCSLLFMEKKAPHSMQPRFVFLARASAVGYDMTGRTIERNDLPVILDAYQQKRDISGLVSDDPVIVNLPYEKLKLVLTVDRYLKDYVSKYPVGTKLTTIGDVCEFRTEVVEPARYPNREFKLFSIHFDGNVTLREETLGKEFRYKKVYVVRKGDIVISRIDCPRGAVGIIPESLDGAVCSQEFYILKAKALPAFYIWSALRTANVQEQILAGQSGLTGRRRIPRQGILDLKIPLPTDSELEELRQQLRAFDRVEREFLSKRRKLDELISDFFDKRQVQQLE